MAFSVNEPASELNQLRPLFPSFSLYLFQQNFLILKKEKESQILMEHTKMFEVQMPDLKPMKQCRKEVKLLKHLWDFYNVVTSSFLNWNTTLWAEINVEVRRPLLTLSQRNNFLLLTIYFAVALRIGCLPNSLHLFLFICLFLYRCSPKLTVLNHYWCLNI